MSDTSCFSDSLPEISYQDLLNPAHRELIEDSGENSKNHDVDYETEDFTDEYGSSSPKKMVTGTDFFEIEEESSPPTASCRVSPELDSSKSVKRKAKSQADELRNYKFKYIFDEIENDTLGESASSTLPPVQPDVTAEKERESPPVKRRKIFSTESTICENNNSTEQRNENLVMYIEEINGQTGEKYFKCAQKDCDGVFKTKSHVKRHVRHVHWSSPITCPYEGCNSLLKGCYLNIHIKKCHTKVETNCTESEPSKDQSAETIREPSTKKNIEKNFCCRFDGCKAVFASKPRLSQHKQRVHASPVKCPYKNCEKLLKLNSLSGHIKSFHEKSI